MEWIRSVSYDRRHMELVESGIEPLSYALYNETEEEKASILLCLDRYLDPYFGYNLPYESEIIILLQHILFEDNSMDIKEDILDLLQFYAKQPLDILEKRLDKLSGKLLMQARYILYDEEPT